MNNSANLILLSAGGTGGHMFPAAALSQDLVSRGYRVEIVTDNRGKKYSHIFNGLPVHVISSGTLGKGIVGKIKGMAALGVGMVQARSVVERLKPSIVVGFGGYPSVPAVFAAQRKKIPTIIHEQNAVLGRTNRILASRVEKIATCFNTVRGVSGEINTKVVRTGMPVRPSVIKCRTIPYPDISNNSRLKLLVFGGSQGARVLSDVVPIAISRLKDNFRTRLIVAQQCRDEDIDRVRAVYEASGVEAELSSFFIDLPTRIANSHLIIGRSGASTVAELTTIGRPAILIPYPYASDKHQSGNAHAIDEAGGGWLIDESVFTPETLAKRLDSLFGLPNILKQGAQNARAVGQPEAAIDLANLVSEIILTGEKDLSDGAIV